MKIVATITNASNTPTTNSAVAEKLHSNLLNISNHLPFTYC